MANLLLKLYPFRRTLRFTHVSTDRPIFREN